MWSPFCNPFVFTFMHVMGVCTPLLNVRMFKSANRSSTAVVERRSRSGRDVSTCFRSIPFVFRFLRTLLRFFALCKNSTLFISSVSALFAKNTGGGGTPPSLEEEQNETTDCQFRVLSVRRTHRTSGGRQALSVGMAGGKERAREKIIGWAAGKSVDLGGRRII